MKTAEEILIEQYEEYKKNEHAPSIPLLAKEYLIKAMEEYATERVKNFNSLPNGSNLLVSPSEALRVALPVGEWIPVEEKLPDNLFYYLVAWELPHPNEGEPNVKGIRSAMCEIYKDKSWIGENQMPVIGVTHWIPLPNPPTGNGG